MLTDIWLIVCFHLYRCLGIFLSFSIFFNTPVGFNSDSLIMLLISPLPVVSREHQWHQTFHTARAQDGHLPSSDLCPPSDTPRPPWSALFPNLHTDINWHETPRGNTHGHWRARYIEVWERDVSGKSEWPADLWVVFYEACEIWLI